VAVSTHPPFLAPPCTFLASSLAFQVAGLSLARMMLPVQVGHLNFVKHFLMACLSEQGLEKIVSQEVARELNDVLQNERGFTTVVELDGLEQMVISCNETNFPISFDEITNPVRPASHTFPASFASLSRKPWPCMVHLLFKCPHHLHNMLQCKSLELSLHSRFMMQRR
jgi:hypothetical protein